jgi:KaiC/GvpD/RAD55 family RecA-like ATPase
MIRGGPGSGKTILGLHFLDYGAAQGQNSLFLTFGESKAELSRNGSPLGFAMERLHFLDLSPSSDHFAESQDYDIFPPSDVERAPIARRIRDEVNTLKPCRVFIDGMTQLRRLSPNAFQFRNEALAFLRFVVEVGCTVMFTSESNEGPDEDLQFIADGSSRWNRRPGGGASSWPSSAVRISARASRRHPYPIRTGEGKCFRGSDSHRRGEQTNENRKRRRSPSASQLRVEGAILVVDDEEIVRKSSKPRSRDMVTKFCWPTTVLKASGRLEKQGKIYRRVAGYDDARYGRGRALQELRAIAPLTPVIGSSGYSEALAMRYFGDKGLAGFLQKPYAAQALAECVKRAVEGRVRSHAG